MNNIELQNKLWSELSEESREDHRQFYAEYKDYAEETFFYNVCRQMEKTFGSHNLNPQPQIKTWKDFIKEFHKDTDWNPKNEFGDLPLYGMDEKVRNKIIATVKIAKLIELGYGGMITDEEWKDEKIKKYCIIPCVTGISEFKIPTCYRVDEKHFIAFHDYEQAEEFMSYETNRNLVSQYYCS